MLPLLCYSRRLVMRMWHVSALSDLNFRQCEIRAVCTRLEAVGFFDWSRRPKKCGRRLFWNYSLSHPLMYECSDILREVDRGQMPVSCPSNGMWNHVRTDKDGNVRDYLCLALNSSILSNNLLQWENKITNCVWELAFRWLTSLLMNLMRTWWGWIETNYLFGL